MLAKTKNIFIALLLYTTAHSTAVHADQCLVTQQKRSIIHDFLCGKYSNNPYFAKSGRGCARASVEVRLFEAARSVHKLKLCGYEYLIPDFLETSKMFRTMLTNLSSCTPEAFAPDELNILFQAEMKEVERQAGNTTCGSEMRAQIVSAVPSIVNEIEQIKNGGFEKMMSTALNITILSDGSVVEK